MKQSGHVNPSEKHELDAPVTSNYGRTPPSKHGGMCRQHNNKTKTHVRMELLNL